MDIHKIIKKETHCLIDVDEADPLSMSIAIATMEIRKREGKPYLVLSPDVADGTDVIVEYGQEFEPKIVNGVPMLNLNDYFVCEGEDDKDYPLILFSTGSDAAFQIPTHYIEAVVDYKSFVKLIRE